MITNIFFIPRNVGVWLVQGISELLIVALIDSLSGFIDVTNKQLL